MRSPYNLYKLGRPVSNINGDFCFSDKGIFKRGDFFIKGFETLSYEEYTIIKGMNDEKMYKTERRYWHEILS